MRRLLFILALLTPVATGCSRPSPSAPTAGPTPAEIDERVKAEVAKALAEERAKRPAEPKQASEAASAAEVLALFQSIRRTELARLEEVAIQYDKNLLDSGNSPDLTKIKKWSHGDYQVFRSGNPMFFFYVNAREEAGYVSQAKRLRVQGSLNNAEFLTIVINGLKKFRGLQSRDDVVAGAELFGKMYPAAPRAAIQFAVQDAVLFCDEDENGILGRAVSNIYKTEVTTRPYAERPAK